MRFFLIFALSMDVAGAKIAETLLADYNIQTWITIINGRLSSNKATILANARNISFVIFLPLFNLIPSQRRNIQISSFSTSSKYTFLFTVHQNFVVVVVVFFFCIS